MATQKRPEYVCCDHRELLMMVTGEIINESEGDDVYGEEMGNGGGHDDFDRIFC